MPLVLIPSRVPSQQTAARDCGHRISGSLRDGLRPLVASFPGRAEAGGRLRRSAPVAQLDRASVYGTEGREFESLRARQSCRGQTPGPKEKGSGFGPLWARSRRAMVSSWERRRLRRGRGSVERACRQHEPTCRAHCGADGCTRPVQATTGRSGRGRVSDTIMVGDPREDRGRVGTLGEDHRPLDHHPSRCVRTSQASHESAYRICCHSVHSIPRSIAARRGRCRLIADSPRL